MLLCKRMRDYSSVRNESWLSWFLRGLLILGTLVLLSRTFELQVIKGSYYRELSEENRIRKIPIFAPRGKILARGGEVLVDNIATKKAIKFSPQSGYEKTDDLTDVPEEDLITEYVRSYALGDKLGHVTGYLGEVSPEEVGKVDPDCAEKGLKIHGTSVGVSGLEYKYNCLLQGVDGEELIEVNTLGKKIRTLGRKEPIPGTDVRTNIDYRLQIAVAESLDQKGAVIVTDPEGEVLALYSYPSYDPNLLTRKNDSEKVSALLKNPDLPFFNRAIGGLFHPGSVFKPLVGIAALSEGKIDQTFSFNDEGRLVVKTLYGEFSYANWYFTQYGGKEGEIDLVRALARSTDTFFYTIGALVGPDKIAEWATKFGLDQKTGIDLPGEVLGLIPTPKWKEEVKKENWFLGNTYHLSIGQGDVSVTPIEINKLTSAIASHGRVCNPTISDQSKKVCKDLNVNRSNIDLVIEGMKEACATGGTGYTFFDFQPQVACKTGTAEVGEGDDTHAWFTVFAPWDKPEIVVTVLVEKGGEGSKVAGPVARKIMDAWNLKNNP